MSTEAEAALAMMEQYNGGKPLEDYESLKEEFKDAKANATDEEVACILMHAAAGNFDDNILMVLLKKFETHDSAFQPLLYNFQMLTVKHMCPSLALMLAQNMHKPVEALEFVIGKDASARRDIANSATAGDWAKGF